MRRAALRRARDFWRYLDFCERRRASGRRGGVAFITGFDNGGLESVPLLLRTAESLAAEGRVPRGKSKSRNDRCSLRRPNLHAHTPTSAKSGARLHLDGLRLLRAATAYVFAGDALEAMPDDIIAYAPEATTKGSHHH